MCWAIWNHTDEDHKYKQDRAHMCIDEKKTHKFKLNEYRLNYKRPEMNTYMVLFIDLILIRMVN